MGYQQEEGGRWCRGVGRGVGGGEDSGRIKDSGHRVGRSNGIPWGSGRCSSKAMGLTDLAQHPHWRIFGDRHFHWAWKTLLMGGPFPPQPRSTSVEILPASGSQVNLSAYYH